MGIQWTGMNVAASINSKNGNATGFTINHKENYFLVMPRHALYKEDKSGFACDECEVIQPVGDIRDGNLNGYHINLKKCLHKIHKEFDVCIIRLFIPSTGGKYKYQLERGIQLTKREGIIEVVNDSAVKLRDIKVGDWVDIIGYPKSIGLSRMQFDYNKPLLKRGAVANVSFKENTIILDSSVYPGNSGSPVYLTETSEFIGMVIQAIPYVQRWKNLSSLNFNDVHENIEYHNSSYSVAISYDAILEVLDMF